MAEGNLNIQNINPITDQSSNQTLNKLQAPKLQLTSNLNMSLESHDESNSQFDKEQLMALEIKQLKKQNNFLKKKLNDLNKQLQQNNGYSFTKTNRNKKLQKRFTMNLDERDQSVKLSVQLFYKQIINLIETVTDLFRLSNKKIDTVEEQNSPMKELSLASQQNKRLNVTKKDVLSKRLQKIVLQKEQNRYQLLLELFIEYYKNKTQIERENVKIVDQMTEKAIQMSRKFLEKGQLKRSLKSSTISSNILDFGDTCQIQNITSQHNFLDKIQKIEQLSEEMFASRQFQKN